jgi:carboxypeptidase Taq
MSLAKLEQQFRRLDRLQHVAAILSWDEAVMMPAAAGEERADAMATLGVVMHEHLTAPELVDYLGVAEIEAAQGKLNAVQSANLREIRRILRRAAALPADLVEASSLAQFRCEQAWRTQRTANDWQNFAPLLAEVVARKREVAAALSSALGVSPYDALLDEYEPFCTSVQIDAWFAQLKDFLPALIEQAIEHQRDQRVEALSGEFPVAAQRDLGRSLMEAVGFDMSHGRLDVSHHPFCGGVATDVRITTRYDESDFTAGLLGVLHETGHAKYEQGRPKALRDQPVGQARGMSMHESQSLLQEMQISRGRDFLKFAAPFIAQAFPSAVSARPSAFSAENLARAFTRVVRTKIRVGADECTYPCHILVRYDLERDLIAGRMQVADIPDAWDAGMRSLLGLSTAGDYRDGCMQDVHWPSGGFGYFPTYTLGAMTAAQLFAAAVRAHPAIPSEIAAGKFTSVNEFLRDKIWSQASVLTTGELLRAATGEELNPKYFEAHLRARYLGDA